MCCGADRPASSFQTFTTSLVHSKAAFAHRPLSRSRSVESSRQSNRTASPNRLTCCGLQEQQGEEAADQDGALHDGCQENSDSHTDYIYSGGKVKGHTGKGRRDPERWSSWWRGEDGGVGGAGSSVLGVLQESRHARGTLRARAAAFHF